MLPFPSKRSELGVYKLNPCWALKAIYEAITVPR